MSVLPMFLTTRKYVIRCKVATLGMRHTEFEGFQSAPRHGDVVIDKGPCYGTSAVLDAPLFLGVIEGGAGIRAEESVIALPTPVMRSRGIYGGLGLTHPPPSSATQFSDPIQRSAEPESIRSRKSRAGVPIWSVPRSTWGSSVVSNTFGGLAAPLLLTSYIFRSNNLSDLILCCECEYALDVQPNTVLESWVVGRCDTAIYWRDLVYFCHCIRHGLEGPRPTLVMSTFGMREMSQHICDSTVVESLLNV